MSRNEYKVEGSNIGIGMSGVYKVQVINSTTEEITLDCDWQKNLILNGGMDTVIGCMLGNLSYYAIAGTGSRPNSITSSTSTITQSGAGVYLYNTSGLPNFTSSYSTYTASVNVGDVLQYSNNSQSTVTSITDGFNLQVNTNYTIGSGNAQTFTIWKTSQTDLEAESKRNSSLLAGAGNCGTTTSGSTKTFRRSYDFSTEISSSTYTEIGVSWTVTKAVKSTFSRILLPSPITVGIGFKLRVVYDLFLSFTPNTPQYFTASISGWPVSPSTTTIATQSIQNFNVSDVSTSGTTTADWYSLEPAAIRGYNGNLAVSFVSNTSTPLAAFGSSIGRNSLDESYNGSMITRVPVG